MIDGLSNTTIGTVRLSIGSKHCTSLRISLLDAKQSISFEGKLHILWILVFDYGLNLSLVSFATHPIVLAMKVVPWALRKSRTTSSSAEWSGIDFVTSALLSSQGSTPRSTFHTFRLKISTRATTALNGKHRRKPWEMNMRRRWLFPLSATPLNASMLSKGPDLRNSHCIHNYVRSSSGILFVENLHHCFS